MAVGVLANAVINITGNVAGMRSAMRETQTQLWGLLTMSNRMGGMIARNLITPFTAYKGMAAIHGLQEKALLAYESNLDAWHGSSFTSRPTRPSKPRIRRTNPGYAAAMQQYGQDMDAYMLDMHHWRLTKPNRQEALAKATEGAAVAAGRQALLASAMLGLGVGLLKAADYASKFTEELNKMTETFGSSTGKVMTFVNKMAESGIGRSDLMSGVSTMGIEMLGVGIQEKMASQMAMNLGERAVDVSSLYNIDQADAVRKMVSGLAGFSRPLKELGVIVTEGRVETEAFVKGLWDGKSAISENAKVQARYSLIMRETARAAGDYQRTSGEMSNQYRALSGNFSNLMETLGNTGIVSGFLMAINGLMKGIQLATSGVVAAYGKWSGLFGNQPGQMKTNLQEWEASNRNNESESRSYADQVIAENFMGKGKHSRHSGLADFGKHLQEGVFNDTGKQQLDLTRRLVGLTEEQVAYMKKLGFKNIVPKDFVPF